jgi:UrcA family protein
MVDGFKKLEIGGKGMLNSKRSIVTSLSCVLLGMALHAPTAFAGLSDDPPSIKVSYNELDLSKQAGAQKLYQRIKRAANTVCEESFSSMGPLRSVRHQRECEQKAIDNAVADVNRPLLSALWKRQTRVASTR